MGIRLPRDMETHANRVAICRGHPGMLATPPRRLERGEVLKSCRMAGSQHRVA